VEGGPGFSGHAWSLRWGRLRLIQNRRPRICRLVRSRRRSAERGDAWMARQKEWAAHGCFDVAGLGGFGLCDS
jgi:hypothetical protein